MFAECVEEKCSSLTTDSVSAEQNNLTFRQPKSPWRDVSTEQDMNCVRAYSDQRRTFFPSRFVRIRAFTPKQKNAGRCMNTSAVIGLDVITC